MINNRMITNMITSTATTSMIMLVKLHFLYKGIYGCDLTHRMADSRNLSY